MRALYRSRAGAAAVRARRASQARRAAVQLCRPSADRGGRRSCARTRPRRGAGMADPPVVLAMPGSRSGEVARLAGMFGETLALAAGARRADRGGGADRAAPAARRSRRRRRRGRSSRASSSSRRRSRRRSASRGRRWPNPAPPRSNSRSPACRWSRPTRSSALEAVVIRRLVRVPSFILANLVLGENVVPELVQEDCTPERLADALVPLIGDTPQRRRQVEAFARLDAIMEIGSRAPAARAADIVLAARIARKVKGRRKRRFRSLEPAISAARSARNRAASRRCRAGAAGRSSGSDPRSFPSTARSSRPCARPRTAR